MIHAVHVILDEPINLDEFATLSAEEEARHLEEIAHEAPSSSEPEFNGLVSRVLFVDDIAFDRKLVSHWLGRVGMQVTAVPDISSALKRVMEEPYDLMITDINLMNESGIDLIREARVCSFTSPILAVTAEESEDIKNQALNAGANAFMHKPMPEDQFIEMSRRLMGLNASGAESPIYSEYIHDHEMVSLITGYVRVLPRKIAILREALAMNDYNVMAYEIAALKGSGTSYGFTTITACAAAAMSAFTSKTPDHAEVKRLTTALVNVMSRVTASKPDRRLKPEPREAVLS